ncbi:hypothetical protein ACFPOU_14465 [Massilia jejuensis]|uniref:Uncharacterized protein n=1 Tax=Massilia jejuensis TaxID=648894 RepID=A0ABW0PI45_9BURK
MENALTERRGERRADPVLGALIDVAIAYRANLGPAVAAAFLRETGVPAALARRVLEGSATTRATTPRRWSARAAPMPRIDVQA